MKLAFTLPAVAAASGAAQWGGLLEDEAILSRPVTNGKPWVGATMRDFKNWLGAWNNTDVSSWPQYRPLAAVDIPEEFDWRADDRAANCPTIKEVRDQAACGSCWAFGATEAINDRLCLETGSQLHLSVQDVTSCCLTCGMGCNGGISSAAYLWYATNGIVDGGNYGDKSGCLSYELEPCAHHTNSSKYQPCSGSQPTPRCPAKCLDNGADWKGSKTMGGAAYAVCENGAGLKACNQAMMQDIYQNGPITAQFMVLPSFEEFDFSTGKVYKPKPGELLPLGGHAIKILGYGTQEGEPYWLIANSWNEDWGDKGFFKMIRGVNTGLIEDPQINGGPFAGHAKKSVVV
jgi:cathepsin B